MLGLSVRPAISGTGLEGVAGSVGDMDCLCFSLATVGHVLVLVELGVVRLVGREFTDFGRDVLARPIRLQSRYLRRLSGLVAQMSSGP